MAERDWRRDLLRVLGAPPTDANLAFLTVWQRREGGHTANSARFNWLNTTRGTQYPAINSVGVRAYPSYETGIAYTAATITSGYPSLVRALRSGNPYTPTLRQGVLGDLSKWVSGSRTQGLGYAASVLDPAAARAAARGEAGARLGESQGGGGLGPIKGAAGGAVAGAAAGAIAGGPIGAGIGAVAGAGAGAAGAALFPAAEKTIDVVTAPADAIRWLFRNWDRVLEVTAGGLLTVVGLILLARQLGAPVGRLGGDALNRFQFGPQVVRAVPEPRERRVYVVDDREAQRLASRARVRAGGRGPSEEVPF